MLTMTEANPSCRARDIVSFRLLEERGNRCLHFSLAGSPFLPQAKRMLNFDNLGYLLLCALKV